MSEREIIKELRLLNRNLEKLLQYLMPQADPSVLDRFRAFRAETLSGRLTLRGISSVDPIRLHELKGIDRVIERAKRNTEMFLKGLPFNDMLIYGPRGTGKSSVIKALFNEYSDRGLRIVEMSQETMLHLDELIELLRGRKEKYILFCDDLSFESPDRNYLSLKGLLEGTLAVRPHNVAVYATSNRRHLIMERVSDNLPAEENGELHPSDSLEEKVSLSDRFGLRLYTGHFGMETYLEIVESYVRQRGLRIDNTILKQKALQWAQEHGSFSGRTARQFVDILEGELSL
jgi:hypothetical protein